MNDGLSDGISQYHASQFVKGVEEASKESGTIKRKLAHFNFLGSNGTGKTSLMSRLLGRAMKEFSPSTGVCDPLVVVDITLPNPSTYHSATMVDSHTWEAVDFDVSFLGQMGKDSIIIPSKPTPTSEPVLPDVDDVYARVPSITQFLESD